MRRRGQAPFATARLGGSGCVGPAGVNSALKASLASRRVNAALAALRGGDEASLRCRAPQHTHAFEGPDRERRRGGWSERRSLGGGPELDQKQAIGVGCACGEPAGGRAASRTASLHPQHAPGARRFSGCVAARPSRWSTCAGAPRMGTFRPPPHLRTSIPSPHRPVATPSPRPSSIAAPAYFGPLPPAESNAYITRGTVRMPFAGESHGVSVHLHRCS